MFVSPLSLNLRLFRLSNLYFQQLLLQETRSWPSTSTSLIAPSLEDASFLKSQFSHGIKKAMNFSGYVAFISFIGNTDPFQVFYTSKPETKSTFYVYCFISKLLLTIRKITPSQGQITPSHNVNHLTSLEFFHLIPSMIRFSTFVTENKNK